MNKQVSHIPSGYKPSPLGPIPEDWEVKRLGEIGEVLMCKRIMKYQTDSCGDIPFFKIGTFGGKPDAYISREVYDEYKTKYSYPKVGDVLISAAGTIGRSVIFDGTPSYYQDSNIVWIDNDNRQVLNKYLFYYYSTINWITDTGTIPRLYNGTLKAIQIPTPPIKQQTRIVSILELWDTAIAKQTALIEKLTLCKRGLMQQLLTGKKRLKGFSGEWKTIELGDTLSYIQPTKYLVVNENYNDTYNTPVLTAGKTFILGYTDETTGVFNDLPAIIFDDFTTESQYVTFPFKAKSSAMKILKAHNSNLYFMFCAMQMIKYSIGGHERHWISKYSHLTLKVPSIEEQNTIASVLLQADKEIEIHKQKLAAMQEQKRGLMQVLLTGKRRVK